MKVCGGCKNTKPLDQFYRHARSPDGRGWWCKACHGKYERATKSIKREDPEFVLREREVHRQRNYKTWQDPQVRERARIRQSGRKRGNGLRRRAPILVWRAIKDGRLTPAHNCERCGHDFSEFKRHGHHADYSKPLDVEWLCSRCHGQEHRKKDGGVLLGTQEPTEA